MQCRVAGVTINDCPKFLPPFPQENSHCIIEADAFRVRTVLPLDLQCVTSILNVFKITEGERNRGDSPRVFLTEKDLHWEPNSSIFEEQEHARTDVTGIILSCPNSAGGQSLVINQVMLSKTVDADDLTADDKFAAVLQFNVNVAVAQLSSNPTNPDTVSEILIPPIIMEPSIPIKGSKLMAITWLEDGQSLVTRP